MSEVTIYEVRTYKADPRKLRKEFPTEYSEWVERTGGGDEKAWVRDCYENGGTHLFDLVQAEIEL